MENTSTDQITSNFTASNGIYAIVGDRMEVTNQLNARIGQLDAMLSLTYGEQGETFRNTNDTLQDDFMWSCSMAIQEIQQLWYVIQTMADAEQSKGDAA